MDREVEVHAGDTAAYDVLKILRDRIGRKKSTAMARRCSVPLSMVPCKGGGEGPALLGNVPHCAAAVSTVRLFPLRTRVLPSASFMYTLRELPRSSPLDGSPRTCPTHSKQGFPTARCPARIPPVTSCSPDTIVRTRPLTLLHLKPLDDSTHAERGTVPSRATPDFRTGESCRTMPWSAGFLGDIRFPRPSLTRREWYLKGHTMLRQHSATARLPPKRIGFNPLLNTGFAQVVIVPIDVAGRWVFSGISHLPRPCIPTLLHSRLISPSSVL
ncbi:hypothetical protein PR048_012539 [Dryococelus australis]|uniref:Uncharacterized protein n=1 Tax=Dryococelus australis TaxID=614101 RepID=A0ABQ9HR26_9NEOP|nr:hypothetical protein PR048_012539 [Dryococelus australis]